MIIKIIVLVSVLLSSIKIYSYYKKAKNEEKTQEILHIIAEMDKTED